MGLFSKSAPVANSTSQRPDLAKILNAAPPRERERLSWAQPEIDYLTHTLPLEEEVLSLASVQGMGMGVAVGLIALTPQRLVTVLGERDRGGARGRALG